MIQFKYRFVTARRWGEDPLGENARYVWRVETVDEKRGTATNTDLLEYINRLGQDGWEVFSDKIDGTSREMLFKHTTR